VPAYNYPSIHRPTPLAGRQRGVICRATNSKPQTQGVTAGSRCTKRAQHHVQQFPSPPTEAGIAGKLGPVLENILTEEGNLTTDNTIPE